jgi:uncharacterized protein YoaH (UPF0181 family)
VVGPEDLLNAGEVATINDEAWTLSHITPSIRGQFSALLKSRARQGLAEERREGILGPEEYREEANALKQQFDGGSYSWGSPLGGKEMAGEAVLASLKSREGMACLIGLLLKEHHGNVPVEKIYELMAVDGKAVGEAVARCMDPNRQRPAMTPGEMKTVEGVRGFRTGTATPS